MNVITEAITKITTEVNGSSDEMTQYIGEALIDTITEEMAAKIMVIGKTIDGSLATMYDLAKKQQKNGKAGFSPAKGMEIIEQYYGITPEDKSGSLATITKIAPAPSQVMDLNLMDLL